MGTWKRHPSAGSPFPALFHFVRLFLPLMPPQDLEQWLPQSRPWRSIHSFSAQWGQMTSQHQSSLRGQDGLRMEKYLLLPHLKSGSRGGKAGLHPHRGIQIRPFQFLLLCDSERLRLSRTYWVFLFLCTWKRSGSSKCHLLSQLEASFQNMTLLLGKRFQKQSS